MKISFSHLLLCDTTSIMMASASIWFMRHHHLNQLATVGICSYFKNVCFAIDFICCWNATCFISVEKALTWINLFNIHLPPKDAHRLDLLFAIRNVQRQKYKAQGRPLRYTTPKAQWKMKVIIYHIIKQCDLKHRGKTLEEAVFLQYIQSLFYSSLKGRLLCDGKERAVNQVEFIRPEGF